ncbi:MAG TPA: DUF2203 domain-containing protein [Elusimicrobiota bacterium]|jgi:hypothetical protein|nr:DUF2203 domain-containing protein [Elusimicrobiota bacterium]
MRYFTREEAEALIPELERVYAAVMELHAKALDKARLMNEKSPDADAPELAIERAQLQFLVNEINGRLRKVFELGGHPKGLDPALVDFPHRLEGREVCLCWKYGEKAITHYHGLDEGFAGRKPLPAPRLH